MVELVQTRKQEISANIFLVNIPTVVHFAGRAISYVVLMIQYFYNHVFETLVLWNSMLGYIFYLILLPLYCIVEFILFVDVYFSNYIILQN